MNYRVVLLAFGCGVGYGYFYITGSAMSNDGLGKVRIHSFPTILRKALIMMRLIKLGLLIGCIVSVIYFWIIPDGKKMVTEYKELQQIRAVHQRMKDEGLKIVPKYKDMQLRYEC